MIDIVLNYLLIAYDTGKWVIDRKKLSKNKITTTIQEANPIVVLEIGRSIVADVELQLGKPNAVISLIKELSIPEMRNITGEMYQAITIVSREAKNKGLNRLLLCCHEFYAGTTRRSQPSKHNFSLLE